MYHAIPKETLCASVQKNGKIIATGLGILDRDYIGIYAIHVKEEFRGQGLARQICTGLLKEGKKHGAENAYLQVVHGNAPARNLYTSLGSMTCIPTGSGYSLYNSRLRSYQTACF